MGILNEKMIIAEVGMTHDGSVGQAERMICEAAEAGVDAVKFQMHISEEETIKNAPTPPYFDAEPRYEYFNRTAFSFEQWKRIKEVCCRNKVAFIVSPFSIEAVKRLETLGVDAIKIPSGEVTNIPFIEYIAQAKIPTIISSGMSSWDELKTCVDVFNRNECEYAILQCTSEYPCPPEKVGLNIIEQLKLDYPNVPIGLSDHSQGIWASVAAWLKGATIIEKHFTLSKKMYGPDAKMSMEPEEMRELCNSIEQLQKAIDNPVDKDHIDEFENMKKIFQKSIVAITDIPKGSVIEESMLGYKKPGVGLEPRYYKEIIGKKVLRDLHFDDIIYRGDVEWN